MEELCTAGTSPDGAKQTTLTSPVADCLVQGARQASSPHNQNREQFYSTGWKTVDLSDQTRKTPLLQLHIT